MAAFLEVSSAALLGLLIGARHALEPDHLAAVSTLTLRTAAPWQGASLGALWGVGHALALGGFGGTLVLLGRKAPVSLERGIGLLVGVLMIGLGLMSWQRALGSPRTEGSRRVEGETPAPSPPRARLQKRTVLVGFVHGLGGSGALVAFLALGLRGTLARTLYLLLFGIGSIAGMALLSGLIGWPASRLHRFPKMERGIGLLAGGLSLGMGLLSLVRALAGTADSRAI